jgi:hypothetical protein
MSPADLAKLAAELRAMARNAVPHYSPSGAPRVSITMTPEWLERLHQAADLIDPPADTEGQQGL